MEAIDRILDLEVPNSVQISPDGKRVVYATSLQYGHKKSDNAVSTIWIAEVGKEKSARQLTSGLFNDQGPKWSTDSLSIVFVSDRAKAGKACALYQLSLGGGEAFPLTTADYEQPISAYAYSPNGKFVAYLSADEKSPEKKAKEEAKDDVQVYGESWDLQRLRLIHVPTKTVTTLVSREGHINDLGWSPDSASVVFTVTKTPEIESILMNGMSIERMGIDSKQSTVISECPFILDSVFGSSVLQWAEDNLYVVATVREGETVTGFAVYSISTSDGKWTRVAGGETDCGAGVLSVGDSALVQITAGLNDEIRTLSGKTIFSDMTMITTWHAIPKIGTNEIGLALAKSTVNHPSEVFYFDGATESLTQLSDHGHSFAEPLAVTTTLSVKSSDGKVVLDGIYYAPKAIVDKGPKTPLPTFVFPHGGPYGRMTDCFISNYGWAQYILRSGYAVMFPNYRGGSGHGDKFATYALHGVGTVDHTDIIDLTQHCIDRNLTDKSRVIIGGWSQGGFHSYIAAVRNGIHGHGWKFRACIAGAGVADSDSMVFTSDIPIWEANLACVSPWDADIKDTRNRQASAVWQFKDAAKEGRIPPMLLLHGQVDARVPVTQAWAFHRACLQHRIPCQLVTYPREGHLFKERKHLVDMIQRVVKFCDQHLT